MLGRTIARAKRLWRRMGATPARTNGADVAPLSFKPVLANPTLGSAAGRRGGVQVGRDNHPLGQFLLVLQVLEDDRIDVLANRRAKLDGGVGVAAGECVL